VTSAGVNRGTTVTVELPLYACDMFSRKENSLLRSAKLEPEFAEVGVFQGCFHHEVGGAAAAPPSELSAAAVGEISASHSVLQTAAAATADMHSLIDGGKESDNAAGAEAGSSFSRQPSSGSGAGSGLGVPVVRQSSRGPGSSGTPFVRQSSRNCQGGSRGGSRGSSRGDSKGEDAVRPAESVENSISSSRSQGSAGSHSGKRSVVGDLDNLGCSLAALSMKHKQLKHAFDSSSSDENVAPTYDPRYKRHHKKQQDRGITLTGPSSSAKSISSVTSASGFTGHSTSLASDAAKPSYFSQMVGSVTAAMSGKSEAVDPHSSHSASENSVGSSGFSVTSASAATSSAHAAAAGGGVLGQDLSELNIRRVLVVDDVESNRKMLVRLLQRKGIKHCMQAEDGQKAVDAYMSSSTSSRSDLDRGRDGGSVGSGSASTGKTSDSFQPFDCILMDSEMPVMNGPNAAKMLRSLGCTVPIVGVSGNVLPADVANFVAHGANAVLPKPMNFDALFGLLSDLHVQKQRHHKLK
jgi:CheY-like chemotaxis protein